MFLNTLFSSSNCFFRMKHFFLIQQYIIIIHNTLQFPYLCFHPIVHWLEIVLILIQPTILPRPTTITHMLKFSYKCFFSVPLFFGMKKVFFSSNNQPYVNVSNNKIPFFPHPIRLWDETTIFSSNHTLFNHTYTHNTSVFFSIQYLFFLHPISCLG